jgi:hypothetical protein
MNDTEKDFIGFKRFPCDICKQRKVLISNKHIGKIICKKCSKHLRDKKCYIYL